MKLLFIITAFALLNFSSAFASLAKDDTVYNYNSRNLVHLVGTVKRIIDSKAFYETKKVEVHWNLANGEYINYGRTHILPYRDLSKESLCADDLYPDMTIYGENDGNNFIGKIKRTFKNGMAEIKWTYKNGKSINREKLYYWDAIHLNPIH